jgi:hypothetical protein
MKVKGCQVIHDIIIGRFGGIAAFCDEFPQFKRGQIKELCKGRSVPNAGLVLELVRVLQLPRSPSWWWGFGSPYKANHGEHL